MNAADPADPTALPEATAGASVDTDNPWLGLASFTEASRAFFFGREQEITELERRVQRKLLTVLFGKSGLGKTSILQAGLVPGLRARGYFPVYLRIDYGHDSPEPVEQIKQAINKAAVEQGAAAGHASAATQGAAHGTPVHAAGHGVCAAPIIDPAESIWEFLHHREAPPDSDAVQRDVSAETRTVKSKLRSSGTAAPPGPAAPTPVPLLIFDQFEELFTLAQSDEFGRARAARFVEELADLVENRPPKALEARLDTDDSIAERFDFSRSDYRVVIALREDYLASLESLKRQMPSLSQNRLRLAPMTGNQALEAVLLPGNRLRPGRPLVTEEVAEAIVRFVAGGSELANAEVEPSLLSLICRELNEQRIAQGRSEISQDLLAGSHQSILSTFYERSLADQPESVRRIIEDSLLTESGYRENLAEESLLKRFQAAGAAPDALTKLVNRRLLRIEERLDVRRVELTHDVLTGVVKASRDQRYEREAREAAERTLAAQGAREAAAQRSMLRARMVAAVCAVLMLIAIAGALFGWLNMRHARAAEIEAQNSRSNAERLVNFLMEDFYAELEPTGRLATLGRLAHMTVGYYDSVPPQLVTDQTRINRAMALVREGASLSEGGNVRAGDKDFDDALAVFAKLRAAGDHGEAVTYGLSLALENRGSFSSSFTMAQRLQEAADLLRPLVYEPGSSRRVRQLYARDLDLLSHTQPFEKGVATCDEARKVLAGLGALDLSDLNAASEYADTADSEARELVSLGQLDAAQKLEQEVYDLAGKVLAQRPDDLHALQDRAEALELLSQVAYRRHDETAAAEDATRAVQAGEDWVRFDPSDQSAWVTWTRALSRAADVQRERGDITSAIATLHSLFTLQQDKRLAFNLGPTVLPQWLALADLQAQTGDFAAATLSMKSFTRNSDAFVAQIRTDDPVLRGLFSLADHGLSDGNLQLIQGAPQAALATATAAVAVAEKFGLPANNASIENLVQVFFLDRNLGVAAQAAIRLGRYAQAEALARRWLKLPPVLHEIYVDDPRTSTSIIDAVLAHAVALQGRADEARQILLPALAYYREQQQAGERGTTFRRDFAYALYVSAISSPADARGRAQRTADLDQATRLIDGASAQAQELSTLRWVAHLIAAARESQPNARS